jgi:hypothetical protein
MGQNSRPGGCIHLLLLASVGLDALVVEVLKSPLVYFAGLGGGEGWDLPIGPGLLRILFALMALMEIGLALLLLYRPILFRTPEELPVSPRSSFVLAYALLGSIPVYGLVLFLLTGRRLDFYAFAVPAAVALLLLTTQGGRWDRLAQNEKVDQNAG